MSVDIATHGAVRSQAGENRGMADDLGLTPDILDPLLEGARARGIADTFEMLGQAAVMLNASGSVLHVSSKAGGILGRELSIAGGHLVGADAEANRQIGKIIGAALAETAGNPGQGVGEVCFLGVEGTESHLRIRAITFADGRNNPFQLLKAIILIDLVAAGV